MNINPLLESEEDFNEEWEAAQAAGLTFAEFLRAKDHEDDCGNR